MDDRPIILSAADKSSAPHLRLILSGSWSELREAPRA